MIYKHESTLYIETPVSSRTEELIGRQELLVKILEHLQSCKTSGYISSYILKTHDKDNSLSCPSVSIIIYQTEIVFLFHFISLFVCLFVYLIVMTVSLCWLVGFMIVYFLLRFFFQIKTDMYT